MTSLAEENAVKIYVVLTTRPNKDDLVAHLTSRAILEAAEVMDDSIWKLIEVDGSFVEGSSNEYALLNFQQELATVNTGESNPPTCFLRLVHLPYIDHIFDGGWTDLTMVPFSVSEYPLFLETIQTWCHTKARVDELKHEAQLLVQYVKALYRLKRDHAVVRFYLNEAVLGTDCPLAGADHGSLCVVAELANEEGILVEYRHADLVRLRQKVQMLLATSCLPVK